MFKKIKHTNHPPDQPTLYWDEECPFCLFWKTRWEIHTNNKVAFESFQDKHIEFPDIPLDEFKKASRVIEPDGKIYSGPDSAYRSLYLAGNKKWHLWYKKYQWFEALSDWGYNHLTKNRPFYYKINTAFFGKNPNHPQNYWIVYLVTFVVLLILLIVFLQ